MGLIYRCICETCNHVFTVYDGEGIRVTGLICNTCGKRSNFPRNAPRPPREGREVPSFLQTSRLFSLARIPDAEIRRFTDEELTNIDEVCKTAFSDDTDQWDDFETAKLIAQKNPCQCHGIVDLAAKAARPDGPNAMTRCPACRSDQVTSKNTGTWD